MPHVSKKKLDPRVSKQIFYFFKAIMADLETEGEVAAFLNSLLTRTEELMLAKRLAAVVLLLEDVPESKITETLKTTYATVEKMRWMLDRKLSGYQIGLKKLKQRKNWRELKKNLLELANKTS